MVSKTEFETAVFESDLSGRDKLIALALSHVCDFKTGENVRSAMQTVADKADVSREWASKRVKALVKQGWFIPDGHGQRNVKRYRLAIPVVKCSSQVEAVEQDEAEEPVVNPSSQVSSPVVNSAPPVVNPSSHNTTDITNKPIKEITEEDLEMMVYGTSNDPAKPGIDSSLDTPLKIEAKGPVCTRPTIGTEDLEVLEYAIDRKVDGSFIGVAMDEEGYWLMWRELVTGSKEKKIEDAAGVLHSLVERGVEYTAHPDVAHAAGVPADSPSVAHN